MKLHTFRIKEFKSIWDSNEVEIDRVGCLVGKNEAGKTAILQALYRLNPIVEEEGEFDVTDDYPRSKVEDYQQDIESNQRSHGIVVEAKFKLDEHEIEAIRNKYGEGVLESPEVIISKGYARNDKDKCTRYVYVPIAEHVLLII